MVLCMYVVTILVVCMYVVMYIPIIPILSTTVLSDIQYIHNTVCIYIYYVHVLVQLYVCKMQVWLHNYIDNKMVHVFYTYMYLHTHYLLSVRLLLPLPLMQPRAVFLRGCLSSASSPSSSSSSSLSSSPSSSSSESLDLKQVYTCVYNIYTCTCIHTWFHNSVYYTAYLVGAAGIGTLLCSQYLWIYYISFFR